MKTELIFEKTSFGSISISGVTFSYDVYLFVNEPRLRKRDKSHSKRINGHKELAKWELKSLIKDNPDILIIGMGQSGVLPMKEKTEKWLQEVIIKKKIELVRGLTPEILQKTNDLITSGKKVAGVFHTTC
jgi:hypothetical protein